MAQQKQVAGKPKTTRLPLIGAYSNRGSSSATDQRFINIFPETRKVEQLENTKIFINKRPGTTLHHTFPTGEARGMLYFNGKFYAAIGNKVYSLTGITQAEVLTLTGSTGPVGMILANSSNLGDYLFICDGTNGWMVKADGTVTSITNTSIYGITITTAGSGYTNGTYAFSVTGGGGSGLAGTYTVTSNTVTSIAISNYGTGYTSAPTIGFPSGGGTGATATASLNEFPSPHSPVPTFIDGYIALAKANTVDVYTCNLDDPTKWAAESYLSAEMFPDVVVALARQNNQVVVFGHNSIEFFYDAANASGSPLTRNDSTTIQMGTCAPYGIYQNEQYCAYIAQSDSGGRAVWFIEGFQPKKVSDEYIERILDAETDISNCRAYGLRTKGHLFYVINLVGLKRTLVYDRDEKLWHEWGSNVAGVNEDFGFNCLADKSDGAVYMLHKSNGTLQRLDPNAYTDNGTPILVELVTNRYDMDSYLRKFLFCVRIVSDRYVNNSITLYWSDDDYQTWSNGKVINLSDNYPAFQRLGQFRRRAFKITHSSDNPLRLESLECVYAEGDY